MAPLPSASHSRQTRVSFPILLSAGGDAADAVVCVLRNAGEVAIFWTLRIVGPMSFMGRIAVARRRPGARRPVEMNRRRWSRPRRWATRQSSTPADPWKGIVGHETSLLRVDWGVRAAGPGRVPIALRPVRDGRSAHQLCKCPGELRQLRARLWRSAVRPGVLQCVWRTRLCVMSRQAGRGVHARAADRGHHVSLLHATRPARLPRAQPAEHRPVKSAKRMRPSAAETACPRGDRRQKRR